MRREVATIISIAAMSFLVGTIINMNFSASGGGNSPWDKVWKTISELETRVHSVEEKLRNTRTIMFVNSSEHDQEFLDKSGTKIGRWVPENPSNNAILSLVYYFEYKAKVPVEPYEEFFIRLFVLDPSGHQLMSEAHLLRAKDLDYQWSPIYGWNNVELEPITNGIFPNQACYVFVAHCPSLPPVKVMLRNITVVIIVSDGIPASSP